MDGIADLVKVLRERTWLSPVSAEEMNHRDRWLADQIEQLGAPAAHQERTEPDLEQQHYQNAHNGYTVPEQCVACRAFAVLDLKAFSTNNDRIRAIDAYRQGEGAPARAAEWQPIDNGNIYVFCDAVNHGNMGCVRGAGHNGPHAFCLPPYPQSPVILKALPPGALAGDSERK
jgi:hypothetical protein